METGAEPGVIVRCTQMETGAEPVVRHTQMETGAEPGVIVRHTKDRG